MKLIWILVGISATVLLSVLLLAYICYRMAFHASKHPLPDGTIETPEGAVYDPFRAQMERWVTESRQTPHEEVEITSFDGLTLRGNYYEYAPGAPIELMFHGYRGSAERDLSGGVHRCFSLGRSALIVHQRASSGSDGHVISFGINEHKDCFSWLEFMLQRFGPDVKIILAGISMGASTVLMAAGRPLPPNVIGVLADCGFSSPKSIIRRELQKMKLPADLVYPLVRLGARLYGHFDLEETSPEKALKHCTVPVIFFHGESDDFVPCEMSRINYEACASRKRLVTIPGAAHGLCYSVAPDTYLQELKDFFGPEASYDETRPAVL